jgi:uncharacterized protein YcbX
VVPGLDLTAINRFPVKSCRGEALRSAVVEPWGLAGDRRWMVVDEDGECLTARDYPQMILVRPELLDGGLRLSTGARDEIVVPVPDGPLTDVTVFRRTPFAARLANEAAHQWFSRVVGRPARLVFLDDPTRRPTNPAFTEPSDRVSFADGYPVLIASESSLELVNEWIDAGPRADEGPLPMIRFRPNLVVNGAAPFAEDGWRRLRIGSAEFRAVKGCDRCVLTTVDPWTARKGKEPIATLSRHRKWDGAVWFAMNLVPDTPGVTVSVGDPVEVLESVPAPDGPPR